jgi:hypothetical protein
MIICKECESEFSSDKGLHCHLKQHGMTMSEYYTRHYPRANKLTGDPLPFRNKEDYFKKDFSTRAQLIKWCGSANRQEVSEYILEALKRRIIEKKLSRGPGHIELKISELPDLGSYISHFGSYTSACEKLGVVPLFGTKLPEDFFKIDTSSIRIFIDTREQKPLVFPNSDSVKLDFGDYTAAGDDYSYTYVDRKSANDFIGTLSLKNLDRFRAELQRAKDLDSYVFVVIESDLNKIYKFNKWGPHSSNLKFIYHNMRLISHEFADTCQFVFTGSRGNSEDIIPRILRYGNSLWGVDLQYYIDNYGMENR